MRTLKNRGCRTWLLTLDLLLIGLGTAGSASAADRQKQVLVLYSTRRDAQIVALGERELPRLLDRGLAEGLDYYSEYIDPTRFPDSVHQEPFRDFLALKYAQQQFDLVIAIDDAALEFLGTFRNDLFSGTPI